MEWQVSILIACTFQNLDYFWRGTSAFWPA